MEHIVQFAIGIDDNAIKERIKAHAYDDIVNGLVAEAKEDLPKRNMFRCGPVNWRLLVDEALENFCEKNREEIIQAAADMLCQSMKRTKKYREAVAEVVDNG